MKRFCSQSFTIASALCLLAVAIPRPCAADVRLPSVFGNQMVLQRGIPIHVWGTADPGEKVTITVGPNETRATADPKGNWAVELPALAGGGPVEVKVRGKNTITLRDVLIGEVWICSGQSNMQWPMYYVRDSKKEVAAATHPKIRLFKVPMRPAAEPAENVDGYWQECTPASVVQFSAVAYFFGLALHEQLGVPIGLIDSSWGGTRIEPWTPPAGFESVPTLNGVLVELHQKEPIYRKKAPAALGQMAHWLPRAQQAEKAGKEIPPPPHWPTEIGPGETVPTRLYNGMIHPFVPLGIRGAIWYQGESNLGDGQAYRDKMQALISGWRSEWKEGDFPFYYVQLAPFRYGRPSALPLIWQAQTEALKIPNTGMAVINDIASLTDIHPKDKQDVGKRLALWALAKTYGKEIVYSGPLYKSMSVDGSKIRVTFDDVGGGLTSRDGKPLNWMTIAGDDRKFVDASAEIVEGKSLLVSSPKVPHPVAVRFAWSELAEPNLENMEGLPASAFRTDNW
jgi:sialate O-acetylesterase